MGEASPKKGWTKWTLEAGLNLPLFSPVLALVFVLAVAGDGGPPLSHVTAPFPKVVVKVGPTNEEMSAERRRVRESEKTPTRAEAQSVQQAIAATRAARNAILRVDQADSESVNLFSDEPVVAVSAVRKIVVEARDGTGLALLPDAHHLGFSGCFAFAADAAFREDLSVAREIALESAGRLDLADSERDDRETAFSTLYYPAARVMCSPAGNAEISQEHREAMAQRFRGELETARAGYYRAYFQADDPMVRYAAREAAHEFRKEFREPAYARAVTYGPDGRMKRDDPMVRRHREMEMDVARSHAAQAADRRFAELLSGDDAVDANAALHGFRQALAEPLRGEDVRAMYAVNRDVLQGMLAGER